MTVIFTVKNKHYLSTNFEADVGQILVSGV